MKKVLIIGNGMMGGSLGMAHTKTGKYIVDFCQIGVVFNNILVQYDKNHGIYLPLYTTSFKAYQQYDFMINCTGLKNAISEKNVIDISSVQYKQNDDTHIFCHPLCGSEKSGRENARADLFENQNCIITTEGKSQELIDLAIEVFNDIGMNVYLCDTVEEHNKNLAYTSHLLHYLAFNGFANLHPALKRLSHSNKEMWEGIFKANKKNIDEALLKFLKLLCVQQYRNSYVTEAIQELVKDIPEHFHGTALKQLLK